MKEIWDLYDHNESLTGKTVVRGEKIEKGFYHPVVHIWVINKSKEILIQKRSQFVERFKGVWATTGGSAVSGESFLIAAQRELEEEIGLSCNDEDLKFLFKRTYVDNITYVYLVNFDGDLNKLVCDREEVEEIRFSNLREINELLEDGQFFDYGSEYFNELEQQINWRNNGRKY